MHFGIAVVGLDHWYTALGLIDTVAASDAVKMAAVAEPRLPRRGYIAERHPDVPLFEHPQEAIGRDDVSLVAICAATDQAPALAKQALAAGKHVLSVKPPARTLSEIDEVIAAAGAAGKFYGSFEGMQRLHPRSRALRALVQDGAIGVPMSYHQVGHGGLPAPWPGEPGGADSWWLHAEQVPGGAWIDHAIYAVDLARFLFDGEVDWASGIVERRIHTELTLEDYGISLMRLISRRGGPSVSLLFEDTWTAEPGGGAHRQQVIGSAGHIRPEGGAWVVSRGGKETHHETEEAPFFPVDDLAQRLATGEALPFGPADARANLAACLEVYRAAAR